MGWPTGATGKWPFLWADFYTESTLEQYYVPKVLLLQFLEIFTNLAFLKVQLELNFRFIFISVEMRANDYPILTKW